MDDKELADLRMRCVEQAARIGSVVRSSENILDIADNFYKYVKDGKRSGNGESSGIGPADEKAPDQKEKKDGKLKGIFG